MDYTTTGLYVMKEMPTLLSTLTLPEGMLYKNVHKVINTFKISNPFFMQYITVSFLGNLIFYFGLKMTVNLR